MWQLKCPKHVSIINVIDCTKLNYIFAHFAAPTTASVWPSKINHKSSHNCPTGTALQTIQWAGMTRLEEGGHGGSWARAQQPNMHWQLKELPPTHIHCHTSLPTTYRHTELHWHLQIAKRGCAYHYFQLGDGNGNDVGDADRDGDADAAVREALLHFATIRKLRIRQVSREREK